MQYLIDWIKQNTNGGTIAFLVIGLLSFVEVSKIKINPWSLLLNHIGSLLNHNITQELKGIKEEISNTAKEVQTLKQDFERQNAINARTRILRFGDELLHEDRKHTKEHFDQIIRDCQSYSQYCEEHPDFENSVIVQTMKYIENAYCKCMEDRSF